MERISNVQKKKVDCVIMTAGGVKIEGLAHIPMDRRLVDEPADPLRPYLAVSEPKITVAGGAAETPIVTLVPKNQIQLAWIVKE